MYVILFILDGCAIAQFKKADTPFLDKISDEGYLSLNCKAVFPTATYTGHSSIITGTYPENHGMVGNQFWDRKNQCLRDFDTFDPNENIQSPTIFNLLPFSTCAICEPVTKGASVVVEKQYFDNLPLEQQNRSVFNALREALNNETQFYMVNFEGVDGFGESVGPESSRYSKCLEEIDGFIAKIASRLKSNFTFIITADHGMTSVDTNIDLGEELREDGFQTKCLASHRCCHIYTDENLDELELHLQKLQYIDQIFDYPKIVEHHLKHERSGDLIVSAKKGFEFGDKILSGSHGGYTKDELFVPLIIYESTGKHEFSLDSASILNICPTILDMFDIQSNNKFQGNSFYI